MLLRRLWRLLLRLLLPEPLLRQPLLRPPRCQLLLPLVCSQDGCLDRISFRLLLLLHRGRPRRLRAFALLRPTRLDARLPHCKVLGLCPEGPVRLLHDVPQAPLQPLACNSDSAAGAGTGSPTADTYRHT